MNNDNVIIIDDFYQDPSTVREVALSCEYSTISSKFFDRSSAFIDPVMREVFEEILDIKIKNNSDWSKLRTVKDSVVTNGSNFNGTFYKPSDKIKKLPNHIHHDCHDWAALVMLSPECPAKHGLYMWENIPKQKSFTSLTYARCHPFDPISKKLEDWRVIEDIEYKYNRMVFYKGCKFHSANILDKDVERINQLWIFDEED